MNDIQLYNRDCLEAMKELEAESIDCILTDPPYKYLKNQKLDRDFDETIFFNEAKRVLKKSGFIVLFGRGTSFYRWNTMLADLGFVFKEEIIWNKSYTSSSMLPISRCHESVSIHSINGIVNNVRVPYIEAKQDDFKSISQDLKRIKSALNSDKELAALQLYLQLGVLEFGEDKKRGYNTTIQGVTKQQCRSVKTMQAITQGMKEKSIIKEKRDHYGGIHPTQKPVRLLERLLALVTKEGDTVLDPFAGSGSTLIACQNLKRKAIGYEIDKEYYEGAMKRIEQLEPELF